jgi:transcriptional regulator
MYLRSEHAEPRVPVLQDFIKANPLGLFVTGIGSDNFPTLQLTHIPWLLDLPDGDNEAALGTLRGHIARANPHAKALIEATARPDSTGNDLKEDVTVMFSGPAESYVTPKFYTTTKPLTGKVVPTWNYSAVQVYGRATIFSDAKDPATQEFLEKALRDLTSSSEADMARRMGNEEQRAWQVEDAPSGYVEIMKKNIIGISIEVTALEGKFKMSQERPVGGREGVVSGFSALKTDEGLVMAETVRERGALHDAQRTAGARDK